MPRSRLFHHHAPDRTRQLRWVAPMVALLLMAVLATLAAQYRLSDQAVGRRGLPLARMNATTPV